MDFQKILVVCNFIHPYYKNIPFIREFYEFPNLLVYGDNTWPVTEGVIPFNQSNGKAVKNGMFQGGFFAYRCMIEAVQGYPDFSGYLFLMDDVLLSRRKFEAMSPQSTYLSIPTHHCDIVKQTPSDRWYWWKSEYGIKACQRAYEKTPEQFKYSLATHAGGPNIFLGEPNDCFYVPKDLAKDFVEAISILSEAEVFTEIAIPTALAMIAAKLQDVKIRYLWGRRRWLWHFYSLLPSNLGIHPVKFSDPQTRSYVSTLKKLHLI